MGEAVDEVIGRIQRGMVETLELEMRPGDLDPDVEFPDLEVIRHGSAGAIDSLDLVESIEPLEEALGLNLLEDGEFRDAVRTIRTMAEFLVSRFGIEGLRALVDPPG